MRHHSMLRWPTRLVVAGGACLLGSFVCAEQKLAVNSPPAEDISRWVQELDSDSYSVREHASKLLSEAGPIAIERLAVAVTDPSTEVSTRAGSILQRIADANDEATLQQVAAALQKLGSKRPAVRKLVADIQTQQKKFKHTRAVAQVRALGGGLTGNWEGEPVHEVEAFIAGPVVAVEEEIEILPAVALEAIPEEEPAPKRGLLGLLGRLIAPAAAPLPLPEFIPPPPDAPDAPDAVPLPALEEVRPLPGIEIAGPPALEEVELAEAPAVAEVFEVADDIALIEPAFAPFPIAFDGEEVEGEAYAELVLDKSFRGGDKDLAVLKDIPEIYNLSIHGAKLTDEALPHIGALPRLTTLNLRDTPFSGAALRKLRQQRPELSVICRSSAMLGINAGMEGACILTSVFFKSGAHDAGLRDGDEILEVDGHKVRDFSDLTISVYPHKPGDKVSVKYSRNNQEHTVDVLLKPRVAVEE
ncbi:PDZ domain-containing protein [Anatilimnocola floriformis]|uniref:PDZ domain-containing protein n=1 Tax=Anatilimnocola floriformis TaxID=2948575 RepID=UPI0020C4BDED|nr:PDZ domain-containing protein [Anatilimnocola floriformis]